MLGLNSRIVIAEIVRNRNTTNDEVGQFFEYAGLFAGHYLAVRWQSGLEPIEYMGQINPVGNIPREQIKLPSQDLFVRAVREFLTHF